MAKLEDLVTPTELLEAVKSGSLKNELAKKYRASEQDLALMLQPLYRQGRLTKEEFNSFFKGIPLPSQSGAEPVAAQASAEPPASTHDAPTEMLPTSNLEKAPKGIKAPPAVTGVSNSVKDPGLQLVSPDFVQPEPEVPPRQEERQTNPSPEGEVHGFATPDSAGVTALMDMIYARLSSIDDRLALIEKKIGSAG